MLAEHFLQMYSDKYKRKDLEFTQGAYNQMLNYSWRGNVRELQHVIERAVLLSKSNRISSLNIPGVPAAEMDTAAAISIPAVSTASAAAGGFAAASSMPVNVNSMMINDGLSGEELFQEIGKFIVDKLPEPADGAGSGDYVLTLTIN
jgi:DNA-binding NtrC family response regulator